MVIDFVPTEISSNCVNVHYEEALQTKNNKGILILDTNTLLLRNLQIMLESIGYTIFISACEFEALNLFNNNRDKINLLLIDCMNSDVNGIELFSIFKTLDPDIKILIIVPEDMDLTFWSNLDIASFIAEPIQLNSLIKVLSEIL